MSSLMLALLLASASAGAAPPDAGTAEPDAGPQVLTALAAEPDAGISSEGERRHIDALALPLVAYNSDVGIQLGVGAQLQAAGGADPYRYQLNAQVLFSTGGLRSHFLRADVPRFLGWNVRVWARVEYHHELYAPYYGIGNQTSERLEDHPGAGGQHPFAWDRVFPIARAGVSVPLGGPFHLFSFLTWQHMEVNAYGGSVLALERPIGFEGGYELQASTGVYLDTRDHEAVPTRGTMVELSARGSTRSAGSSVTYGGVTARALQFEPLTPRLVLAMRLEGDLLSRDTPFWSLQSFGGIDAIEGIGGQSSARGIPQNLYIGRMKALGTVALRATLAEFKVFGKSTDFGTETFVDAGRVWQLAGDDGPPLLIHVGYGIGGRLWRRSFVLRLDVASSVDRSFNAYFLFGHFF